jgi:CRP-like cAMP-binding protein
MPTPVADKVYENFSLYPKRVYPKGHILVFADESPEHIFYIVKGRVRKYDVSYRGDEVIVNIFQPPAYFPMSWVINKTPNSYFYKTEEETEVHLVPAEKALEFLQANPDVVLDLLSRVYKGMDGLLGRVVHLMSGTARSRLIYELIIECRRFGVTKNNKNYNLTTNEVDLAARSGLSRETISREMQKLKHSGWIELTSKIITVTDISLLEQALGSEL